MALQPAARLLTFTYCIFLRVFIPNLTFEDDLCGRSKRHTKGTQQAVRDLAPVMGILADDGDVVLVPEVPRESELPECLKHVRFADSLNTEEGEVGIVPFGWTDDVRKTAAACGMPSCEIPNVEAVRCVNSRDFNADHDVVLSEGGNSFDDSAFGCLCRSSNEVREAVARFRRDGFDRWVAKCRISHAGRNRLLGTNSDFNQQQSGWLERQLKDSGCVYVEPWVERLDEWGLQFVIKGTDDRSSDSQSDTVWFTGAAKLINDDMGRYQGSVVRSADTAAGIPEAAIRHGSNVCQAAERRGYRGPVGIDCFRYRTPSGSSSMRLCNDINARFTMGQFALQFVEQLTADDETAFWGQFRSDVFWGNLPVASDSSDVRSVHDVRVILTSPRTIQSRPVQTVTALLTGPSEPAVRQVRNMLAETSSK